MARPSTKVVRHAIFGLQRHPDLFTQRLGRPPQPRRSFRAAPSPGCARHYPQAVGDVLRVLGFLEQFQALFAQRLNPSMVALAQRRKGRIHEAYGNIGAITDLSK
jgi:hypothetical protein